MRLWPANSNTNTDVALVLLLRFVAALPRGAAAAVASAVAPLTLLWPRVRRRIRTNLDRCGARGALRTVLAYARYLVDLAHLERRLPKVRGSLTVRGGAVVITAHLGHWEVGAAALGRPATCVTLREHPFRARVRRRYGVDTVYSDDPAVLLKLLRKLRAGELVLMAVDRPYGRTCRTRFLGTPLKFPFRPSFWRAGPGSR